MTVFKAPIISQQCVAISSRNFCYKQRLKQGPTWRLHRKAMKASRLHAPAGPLARREGPAQDALDRLRLGRRPAGAAAVPGPTLCSRQTNHPPMGHPLHSTTKTNRGSAAAWPSLGERGSARIGIYGTALHEWCTVYCMPASLGRFS
jgi:hypothetical protein